MGLLRVRPEGIPAELKRHDRWCLWRLEQQNSRWKKQPLDLSNKPIDVTSSESWSSFEDVWAEYDKGIYSGIGFCLAAEGLVFVDYDSEDTPLTLNDLGPFLVKGWTERSPSGTGLHTVVVAGKKAKACRFVPDSPKIKQVEIYDRNRYFTVTGHLAGECAELWANQVDIDHLCTYLPETRVRKANGHCHARSADQTLLRMMASPQWKQIGPLWSGENITDHSAADMALMNHLAYWTDSNASAMLRLFAESKLGHRKKWLNRYDYQQLTLDKALNALHSPRPKLENNEAG